MIAQLLHIRSAGGQGMSIGERLRRARLEQGLTLADLSEQTKVQYWILDAIERDDVARVPGGVFIRGYLMSFARAVGLDGERIWADFRAELPSPTAEPAAAQQRAVPTIGIWTIVRVAAIVLVIAVVWRNIPRANPDTVPPAAPPLAEERTSDVVLATATAATTGSVANESVPAVDVTKVVVQTAPVVAKPKIVVTPPAASPITDPVVAEAAPAPPQETPETAAPTVDDTPVVASEAASTEEQAPGLP